MRYQVNGKEFSSKEQAEGEIAVSGEGFTEEGRLKLGLKDVQDLAGPQKGMTDEGRAPGKGLEPQESTRIKLEVKALCNSDAFKTASQTSSIKISKSKCWPFL